MVGSSAHVTVLDAEELVEATAIGLVQPHDPGGTSQSSSLIWIVPPLEGDVEWFDAMFGESTEEMVWAVSVARTSQPRACIARLYVSGDVKRQRNQAKRQDERGKADATAELKDAGTSVTRMEDGVVNGCEVGRKTLCAEPEGSPG